MPCYGFLCAGEQNVLRLVFTRRFLAWCGRGFRGPAYHFVSEAVRHSHASIAIAEAPRGCKVYFSSLDGRDILGLLAVGQCAPGHQARRALHGLHVATAACSLCRPASAQGFLRSRCMGVDPTPWNLSA